MFDTKLAYAQFASNFQVNYQVWRKRREKAEKWPVVMKMGKAIPLPKRALEHVFHTMPLVMHISSTKLR